MSKAFHISDVVSVTSEVLVSERGMSGIYDVISHMVGFDAMTHELPTLFDVVMPEILTQHPQLKNLVVPEFEDPEIDVPIFSDGLVMRFGETLELEPMVGIVGRVSFAEAQANARARLNK